MSDWRGKPVEMLVRLKNNFPPSLVQVQVQVQVPGKKIEWFCRSLLPFFGASEIYDPPKGGWFRIKVFSFEFYLFVIECPLCREISRKHIKNYFVFLFLFCFILYISSQHRVPWLFLPFAQHLDRPQCRMFSLSAPDFCQRSCWRRSCWRRRPSPQCPGSWRPSKDPQLLPASSGNSMDYMVI